MNFLFLDTLGYESALRLSGHHYARLLVARGHRVLSISAPVTPWHRLSRHTRKAVERRFEAHRAGFRPAPGGVEHYVPHSWFPVRNQWPFDRAFAPGLSASFYRRDIMRRLRQKDFTPDVLSLQNLMFHPLVREFPGATLHYRMTDHMAAFSDYPGCLARLESKVLEQADIISLTSRQFFRHLIEAQKAKALYAPNGVDLAHFSRPRARPAEFAAINRPIVIYVGALRDGFDWELLAGTSRQLNDVQFVIVSPDRPREDILGQSNFLYIPGVPYEDVPAYYQHADVTIVPFEDSPLVAPVNPIKMFESLASGTPVVAREWEELKKLQAPVGLARDPASMAAAIRKAIGEKHSGPRSYEAFLREHSWEGNLDRLLERIERVRGGKSTGKH